MGAYYLPPPAHVPYFYMKLYYVMAVLCNWGAHNVLKGGGGGGGRGRGREGEQTEKIPKKNKSKVFNLERSGQQLGRDSAK